MSISSKKTAVPATVTLLLLLTSIPCCGALSNAVQETTSKKFSKVYNLFGITPKEPIVCLKRCDEESSLGDDDNNNIKGYGLFAERDIASGETILAVPQSACLKDDEPPNWLQGLFPSKEQTQYDWILRLAAVFLDCYTKHYLTASPDANTDDDNEETSTTAAAYRLWLSMLTDADTFRKVLPVHWKTETVRKTGSIELQLGVAAYHSPDSNDGRAIKANKMLELLLATQHDDTKRGKLPTEKDCRYAMDIVESRSCRLGTRCVVAPVFDFFNHDNNANAEFSFAQQGEEEGSSDDSTTTTTTSDEGNLVVRAMRGITKGEEICVDYGASASPAYRSLFTYGFINREKPSFAFILRDPSSPPKSTNDDNDTETPPPQQPATRLFTVQPSSVPYDLVATVCQMLGEKNVALTPNVLMHLLDCVNRQADNIFSVGPPTTTSKDDNDDSAKETDNNNKKDDSTQSDAGISEKLAKELKNLERQALRDFQEKLSGLVESQ